MNPQEIHTYLLNQHRNIYQEAQLFEQNRKPVESYLDALADPFHSSNPLSFEPGKLKSSTNSYPVTKNVIDFRKTGNDPDSPKWEELNKTLLNYQVFLTPYVLLNSLPLYNYVASRTGLNKLQNARVVDVGAGTGQTFGTFFYHPETIEYFLVDPNLRFLHDQFLRLYPKFTEYPIAHILCYAENLPFKNESVDLVMSISSIDHFKDYIQFIREAHRILRQNGQILVSSHLDSAPAQNLLSSIPKELTPPSQREKSFSYKLHNRFALKAEYKARKFHNKKRGSVPDDHMHHFDNTKLLEKALSENGFKVEQAEIFKQNFFIKARKV